MRCALRQKGLQSSKKSSVYNVARVAYRTCFAIQLKKLLCDMCAALSAPASRDLLVGTRGRIGQALPQDQVPRVRGAFRSVVDALRGLSLLIDCSLRNLRQGLISRFFLLESFLQKRDSIVQTQLFRPGDQRSVA